MSAKCVLVAEKVKTNLIIGYHTFKSHSVHTHWVGKLFLIQKKLIINCKMTTSVNQAHNNTGKFLKWANVCMLPDQLIY